MLEDGRVAWIDRAHNSRQEERKTLYSDVVEQEDRGYGNRDWREDTAHKLLLVKLVKDSGCADTFGLDSGDGKVAFLCCKPPGGLWAVCEREERDYSKAAGDDAFDRLYEVSLMQCEE